MTILNNIAKETVELQKTVFDDSFNLLVKYADNVENLTATIIDRYGNLPENVRGNIEQLNGKAKEGRAQFKKIVDDNFKNLEKALAN